MNWKEQKLACDTTICWLEGHLDLLELASQKPNSLFLQLALVFVILGLTEMVSKAFVISVNKLMVLIKSVHMSYFQKYVCMLQ